MQQTSFGFLATLCLAFCPWLIVFSAMISEGVARMRAHGHGSNLPKEIAAPSPLNNGPEDDLHLLAC